MQRGRRIQAGVAAKNGVYQSMDFSLTETRLREG
jgi:hypothetical protein